MMDETAEIETSTKHQNLQLDESNMRRSPKKNATKTRKRPKNSKSNVRKTPEINLPTMIESTANDISLPREENDITIMLENPETSPEKTLSLTPEDPEKNLEKNVTMIPESPEIDVRIQESPENSVSMTLESPEKTVNSTMPAGPESEILKMLGAAINMSMMVTPEMLDNDAKDKDEESTIPRRKRKDEQSPSMSIYSDVSEDEVPTPPQRYKRKVQHYFIYLQFKIWNAIGLILGTLHVFKFPAKRQIMN